MAEAVFCALIDRLVVEGRGVQHGLDLVGKLVALLYHHQDPRIRRSCHRARSAQKIPWKCYDGGYNVSGTSAPLDGLYCNICNCSNIS